MSVPIRRSYLLTGATGALGREILARILRDDPGAEVTLLVRSSGREDAAARLYELDQYVRAFFWPLGASWVSAVAGDVGRPRLGLARGEYRRLAARVTHLVHCAATVKFRLPLDAARRVNVDGTREVLAFAGRCPRLVRFSHVSSAYVSGDRQGVIREDELDRGQGFHNPYERSKFEAEILVRSHMGSLPITVFRPSIIVGDSRDGHLCSFATIYRPLRAIALGRAGDIPGDPDTPLDLVPVDYVAEAVARLTHHAPRRAATYHVTAGRGNEVPVRAVIECGLRCMTAGGPGVRARWTGAVAEPLLPFAGYLSGIREFDDSGLRADLGDGLAGCPRPARYLSALFRYFASTDWGARRPWTELPPLLVEAR